jgi:hypothetical protein
MSDAGNGLKDDSLFFEVKTIGLSKYGGRKPQSLLDSARHNRRKIQAELGARSHIAPERTHLNQTIAGPSTPEGVVELAVALMATTDTDVKQLRKDYTQAYELLFSLPPDTCIDIDVFFRHCLRWAEEQFDKDIILSGDIHRDEAAPHLHVLLVPIINGRYVGSKLITRQELSGLRESFANLALSYGLREPVRRLQGAAREDATQAVLAHLEATHDPLLQSALWFMVKSDIARSPARYAAKLGIALAEKQVPAKRLKSMAEVFTSKGKGPKTEGRVKPIGFDQAAFDSTPKPIGFESDGVKDHKKIETIALLVSPNIHRSFHPHDDAPTAEIEVPAKPDLANTDLPMPAPASRRTAPKPCTGDDISRTTRVKDTDLDAGAWDTECGEFVSPVIPTTFESIHDIRSDTRVPAVVPDDTYVERDDTYQPDFSESEAYPWQG